MRWLLISLGCVALGCSSYEANPQSSERELQLLQDRYGATRPRSVLVIPVQDPGLSPPDPESQRGLMKLDRRGFQQALVDSLAQVLDPRQRVEVAPVDSSSAPGYALAHDFDVVLSVDVTRFNAQFLGTTGWWYPNALFVGWYFWPIGSWLIADERFGVDCAAAISLLDTHSERPVGGLERAAVEVVSRVDEAEAEPTVVAPPDYVLSDSERGLDFLGTWFPGDLDPDQWETVGALLRPIAERHLALQVAAGVADALDRDAALSELDRERRFATTQAVVIGLSEYVDAPCVGAKADAEEVAALLQGDGTALDAAGAEVGPLRPWLPRKNVALLLNTQASTSAIASTLAAAAGRSRREDTLLFYAAGRGRIAQGPGGSELELVDPQGRGLRLSELAEQLEGCAAQRRVFVFDVDFVEGPRGLPGAGPPPDRDALLAQLRALFHPEGEGAVVLASSLSAGERVQTYAIDAASERGVLTHYLLRCLRGEGDAGQDGLTWADVSTYLDGYVFNLSEVALAHPQRPLLVAQVRDAIVGPAVAASD